MTDVSEPIGEGLHYYVLPKDGDPVAALNILREAAGLGPWPSDDAPVTEHCPYEGKEGKGSE
jgi:hypothetical protein